MTSVSRDRSSVARFVVAAGLGSVLASGLSLLPYLFNGGCKAALPTSITTEVTVRVLPFGVECLSTEPLGAQQVFLGPSWTEWTLSTLAIGAIIWLTRGSRDRVRAAARGAVIVIVMLAMIGFFYLGVGELAPSVSAAFALTFVVATAQAGYAVRHDPAAMFRAGLAAGAAPLVASPVWATLYAADVEQLAAAAAAATGALVFSGIAIRPRTVTTHPSDSNRRSHSEASTGSG